MAGFAAYGCWLDWLDWLSLALAYWLAYWLIGLGSELGVNVGVKQVQNRLTRVSRQLGRSVISKISRGN